jgi:putative pyrroloquinoline-quinone binding quinoprotein
MLPRKNRSLRAAMRIPARSTRRAVRGAALAAAACLAAACTSGGSGAASSAPGSIQNPGGPPRIALGPGDAKQPHPAADWPEFDLNAARTGAAEGLPNAGKLTHRWTARLDGAVYGQPLAVGRSVIAATENDSVYALNRSTGRVIWRHHLGTPVQSGQVQCGNIFPLGITGTPVYDRGNGLVYAVAEMFISNGVHHVLFGLSVRDGAVRVERDIPAPDKNPQQDQQRPGLTIDRGRVYVAFGGLAGDCGQYRGTLVGVPLSGDGQIISYMTPTSREGAIWGTGGPVVGPNGDLWVSTGNGAAGPGDRYDGSDSVLRLSPSLHPISFFAPSTWADDNAHDLDLGSSQPVLTAGDTAFIMGKRGIGYLLNSLNLGGIGHERAAESICGAYGAAAVSGNIVYEPCSGGPLAAIAVNAQQGEIRVLWHGPAGAAGSPVLGGGAVWVTSYSDSGGALYELNPANGAVLSQLAITEGMPHFSSLSLAGRTAFVSTLHGVVAIDGV